MGETMKTTMIILLCTIFIFCSCEGERGLTGATGEQGEQGEQGEDLEIIIKTGIFMACDLYDFWTFEFKKSLDKSIVTVDVRESKDDLWFKPKYWFYDDYIIYIGHDDIVKPGFEYKIAIAR